MTTAPLLPEELVLNREHFRGASPFPSRVITVADSVGVKRRQLDDGYLQPEERAALLEWVISSRELNAVYAKIGYAPDLGRELRDTVKKVGALFPAGQTSPPDPFDYDELFDKAEDLLQEFERCLSRPLLMSCLLSWPSYKKLRPEVLNDIAKVREELNHKRQTRSREVIEISFTRKINTICKLLREENNEKKEQLDDVIIEPFWGRLWDGPDSISFKEVVLEQTKKYLGAP